MGLTANPKLSSIYATKGDIVEASKALHVRNKEQIDSLQIQVKALETIKKEMTDYHVKALETLQKNQEQREIIWETREGIVENRVKCLEDSWDQKTVELEKRYEQKIKSLEKQHDERTAMLQSTNEFLLTQLEKALSNLKINVQVSEVVKQ